MRQLVILFLIAGPLCASAQQEDIVVDLPAIKAVVGQWCDAHNEKNEILFEQLYAPILIFYGTEVKRDKCISIKFDRLNSDKYFHLSINQNPTVTVYSPNIIKCDFVKQVTSGKKVTGYESYLLMKNNGATYQIIGEGDVLTDSRLNYQLPLGKQIPLQNVKVITSPVKNQNALKHGEKREATKNDGVTRVFVFIGIFAGIAVIFYTIRPYLGARQNQPLSKEHLPEPVDEVVEVQGGNESFPSHVKPNLHSPQLSWSNFVKGKGDAFETYIVNRFDKKYYTLINWQSDKKATNHYPLSNHNPDLEWRFEHKGFIRNFAVECKYRQVLIDGFSLEPRQYENYSRYKNETNNEVYVALGVGGEPNNPAEMYVIPLRALNNSKTLTRSVLGKYRRSSKGQFFYDRNRDLLT